MYTCVCCVACGVQIGAAMLVVAHSIKDMPKVRNYAGKRRGCGWLGGLGVGEVG